MKKFVLLGVLVMAIAISGCISPPEPTPPEGECNDTSELMVLMDGTVINQDVCDAKGIADKVVVFHSYGCPACAIVVPILEELQNEMDYGFEFIELSSCRERVYELGIIPAMIPTVIIKCRAYVGARTKEEYRSLIGG